MKWAIFTALASLTACTMLPKDDSFEMQAQVRQHDQDVAAKQKRERDASSDMAARAVAMEARQSEEKAANEARNQRKIELIRKQQAVADWKNGWGEECAQVMNYEVCGSAAPALATPEDKALCETECSAAILRGLEALAQSSLTACVASEGEALCKIAFPPLAADRKGNPMPQERLAAANAACSKQCVGDRAQAAIQVKERPKASAAAEGLVLSYKRCMLAVDSTRQAFTYRVHDTELYQDLLAKADARCRAANRCDWLEKYSDDWRCSYGNGN
jgi:hypothetical protein